MWKLTKRGARGTPFVDVDQFASLTEAADAIMTMEDDWMVYFSFEVVVNTHKPDSDADALSCLTYQGKAHYCVLERSAN
jgi:hypothetical protein